MPKMIDPELGLETVCCRALGCRHDTCVGDDDVEWLTLGDQPVCASPNARQACQVELDELDTPAACRRFLLRAADRPFRLAQMAGRSDDCCTVAREGPCRLHAKSGR